jgi:hypothetical protein
LVGSLEVELPELAFCVEPPELVLGVELLEPVPDVPKVLFDELLPKPPYVVSWSPLMPRRSRPNDCQAQ